MHNSLERAIDGLETDLNDLLARYRRLRQERKELLAACRFALMFVGEIDEIATSGQYDWNADPKCITLKIADATTELTAIIAKCEEE